MQHLSNPLNKYLVKLVNKEAEQMYPITPPPLPKYQKPPKVKLVAGLVNFIKSNVCELRP